MRQKVKEILASREMSKNIKTINRTDLEGFVFYYFDKSEFDIMYDEYFIRKDYIAFEKSSNKKKLFIIDCGANIGVSLIYYKKMYPDADILAFEPSKECFNLLQKNIKINNLKDVKLKNIALGYEDSISAFYTGGSNTSLGNSLHSFFPHSPFPIENYKVLVKKLSTFIDRRVDYLKIDIEGAEYAVLDDLKKAQSFDYIDRIVMEVHETDKIDKCLDYVINILKENYNKINIKKTDQIFFREDLQKFFKREHRELYLITAEK